MKVVKSHVSSKQGIFPIKDFAHIALVKGLFLPSVMIQESGKSPIFHNL